jgi:hypothetical protein
MNSHSVAEKRGLFFHEEDQISKVSVIQVEKVYIYTYVYTSTLYTVLNKRVLVYIFFLKKPLRGPDLKSQCNSTLYTVVCVCACE